MVNDRKNPFPGKLYNKATKYGDELRDVYEGCKIDYRGRDVNPEVWTSVM